MLPIAAVALLAACEDPVVLGVRAHELRELLRSGDVSLLRNARPERLGELARLGPGALYYAARAVGLAGDEERETLLLRLAAERETGIPRRRARELLLDRLYARRDWAALLALSGPRPDPGPEGYLARKRRVEALLGLNRSSDARKELAGLEADFPLESSGDPVVPALRLRSCGSLPEWTELTRGLFALPSARAEDLAAAYEATQAPEVSSPFSEEERILFRLRVEAARRDYGAAYRVISGGNAELLGAGSPRAYLADAGKAFLYAPALGEGVRFMAGVEARAAALPEDAGDILHVALLYRGRMLRQDGRPGEAAEAFGRAWESARNGQDRDAAAWYRAESLASVDRRAAAEWLARTAPSWRDPASFADVLEKLARESLLAGDGATLEILRSEAAPRMPPRASTRLVYLAGRAAETGIAAPPGLAGKGAEKAAGRREYARRAYEDVLERSPEPYYRLLAAHRLGRPPAQIPAPRPVQPRPEDAGPDGEDLLRGFMDYGLSGLAAAEVRALEGTPDALGPEALRRLSLRLREAGEWAQSMLVINRLFETPGYRPSREDWELLWPRPWRSEVAESAAAAGIGEHLLYGLIRSESFFRPAVVSRAGAVGLAQLMPATAEEAARRLRIETYDLTDPRDNIVLGSAHFAGLLRPLTGRVLPSVFAYNAGLSRVRAWERAAPGFPDDLLLESLSIEETRQYGRNVLWASVVYGSLHYGMDPEETLREMLGE